MKIKYNGHISVSDTIVFVTSKNGSQRTLDEELAKLLPTGDGYCEMEINIVVHDGESCLRVERGE